MAEQPQPEERQPTPPRRGKMSGREMAFIILMLALAVVAAFAMEWYISGLS